MGTRLGRGSTGGGTSTGGGGGTPAVLSGNEVEVLYDNRPDDETALTQTAGAANWSRTFDLDLGRALAEADNDKDLRICFSYTQQTAGRTVDLQVKVSSFRSWTEFTTSTAVSTGLPVGNQKFPISRGTSNTDDLNNAWNRQGMVFRRGDSDDGNHVLGIVIPAGDNNSGYVAISNFRGVVELVPRVSGLSVSGGGGGSGTGGGLFSLVDAFPKPTADTVDKGYVDKWTGQAVIGRNLPFVSTDATKTWASLSAYLDNTEAGEDEDLTIATSLPAHTATGNAASTDEDDYLYVVDEDRFYFGDTNAVGGHSWYADSPADALEALCNRYRTGESGTVLGASADVTFLHQHPDEDTATDALRRLTVDLDARYYVFFDTRIRDFFILDAYEPPGTTQNHYYLEPVKAEPNAPSVITRAGTNALDPAHLRLNQLLLEGGHLSYIHPVLRDGHGATFTWVDYAGEGYTYPTGGSWRGTVHYYQSLLGFADPQNGDRAFVWSGANRGFWTYVVGHGVLATDWYHDSNPPPGYNFIGYPAAEADANALAQEHIEAGDSPTSLLAYFGGGRLQRLSVYAAPTATHVDKEFRHVMPGNHPVYYFWGAFANERWPSSFPDSTNDSTRKVEWRGRLVGDIHREEYDTHPSSARPVFLGVGDVSSDIDTLAPTTNANMVFTLPAGRWNVEGWFSEEDDTPPDESSFSLRRITSGTDDIEVIGGSPGQVLANDYPVYKFEILDLLTDGTEQFYVRVSNLQGEDSRQWLRCEKVG